jgi:protein arginine kinase activator
MHCQICNKNEATIHLTEITDGMRSEMHVCEHCAAEEGISVKSQIPLNELLSNLLASAPSDEEMLDPTDIKQGCESCGMTLEDYKKEALLGCPNDYNVFEKSLAPLIAKAHNGSTAHRGKVPSKAPEETKNQMELITLRQQLKMAVEKEDYEKAAKLRDQINVLEEQ